TLFVAQGLVFHDTIEWIRLPNTGLFDKAEPVPYFWHLLGTIGVVLFGARFWVQWWCAEAAQKSFLGPAFWWLSLFGAILSILYFIVIRDIVNLVGPAFGLIPYIRNLMLLKKDKPQTAVETNI